MSTLQSSGQLCAFLEDHLGNRIASPAAIRPVHDRFVKAVAAFAEQQQLPVVHFESRLRAGIGRCDSIARQS